MKITTVIKTDAREIEALLEKYYGITHYEIVPAEEISNYSTLDYNIDGKLSEYDIERVNKILIGKFLHYSTSALMNKLCADGHIQVGNYLISCRW